MQPGNSRQIEIQDHQIVALVGSQLFRLRPARNHLHSELLLLQALAQEFRKRRVIFSDKNAHRLTQNTWIVEGVHRVWTECGRVSRHCERVLAERASPK